METVELFGETLRYDDEQSDRDTLVWQGPTIGVSIHRRLDYAAARWSLIVDGDNLIHATYDHATVAEAAQHLATILMDEIEDRAQVARRLLAGLNVELRGGEQ